MIIDWKKCNAPILLPDNFFTIAHTTLRCNYFCPFCIQRHEENDRKTIFGFNEITTEQWITGLKYFSAPYLVLSGGEITLRDDPAIIAIAVADNYGFVELGTNLSKDPTLYIRQIIESGKKNIRIGVSFHPNQVKNHKLFLYYIKKIMESPVELNVVSIVDTPDNEGKKNFEKFSKMGIPKLSLAPFEGFWDEGIRKYHRGGKLYPNHHKFYDAGGRYHKKTVRCKTTLMIFSPNGSIHRCSHLCYINSLNNMGSLLDVDVDKIKKEISDGALCELFGQCNPCNVGRIIIKLLNDKSDNWEEY